MSADPASSALGPVLELRQYTLHPGQRDVLIELFDRELVEPQEDCGMRVIGQFRDLDAPDRFVWLRGFADMEARRRALSAFYDGPIWSRHRNAANATMIDSDDVLLLRPSAPGRGFSDAPVVRPREGTLPGTSALFTATLYPLAEEPGPDVLDFFSDVVDPVLDEAGGTAVAELQTAAYENTFPRLPVREGEHRLVRFRRFACPEDQDAHLQRSSASPAWPKIEDRLRDLLVGPAERLRLQPTSRSALR